MKPNLNLKPIIYGLFIFGILIRILGITIIPCGLNQDEASIGYETFSLLNSGLDRNGNSFPVHFVSWGSGQNALYAYLSMPFVSLFGLNSFSVRIVNALFSCLSLFVFYFTFRLSFSQRKSLFALFILVIAPQSIMSARWGLEGNIFPTLFLTGFYFLLKNTHSKKLIHLIFSGALFGISLYAYGVSYLIVPLFILISVSYLLITHKMTIKDALLFALAFTVIAIPIFLFILINHFDLQPITLGSITIPRMESNRTTAIFNLFSGNPMLRLPFNSIRFFSILFLQSDGLIYNAIPSFGLCYVFSTPFFLIGIMNTIRKKAFKNQIIHLLFLSWFVCCVVLGATSNVNINRMNALLFPFLFYVIIGIMDVGKLIPLPYKRKYKLFIFGLYLISFCLFAGHYVTFFNREIQSGFAYGFEEALHYADEQAAGEEICITTKNISMPYIYVCFYNALSPDVSRSTVVYDTSPESDGAFKTVKRVANYSFGINKHTNAKVYIMSEEEADCFDKSGFNIKKFTNFFVITSSISDLCPKENSLNNTFSGYETRHYKQQEVIYEQTNNDKRQ